MLQLFYEIRALDIIFILTVIIIYYDLTLLSIGLYRIVSVKYKRKLNCIT